MRKLIFFFFFLLYNFNVQANNNTVYLDIQFIIDKSDIGVFYKDKIKIIENEGKIQLSDKQKSIENKKTAINNQKNILKKEEIDKKIIELNKLATEYQISAQKLNNQIVSEKKKYSKKILEILNPLLTEYVKSKNIKLVLEKKNVLVGIKNLDITSDILKILNTETKNKKFLNDN
tara:strand:+ start:417 stop:941 length:525 start_codon:yes stop_codon:yes gene_type:complete